VVIKLKTLLFEGLNTKEIQSIIDRVYPQIIKNLGATRKATPRVTLHNNPYARLSGIEDMIGDTNDHAEYDWQTNEIYIYIQAMRTIEDVIRSLLHEYTHAKQSHTQGEEYAKKYNYKNNPHEIQAARAEVNWRKYL
jgi:hypothetical protein